MSLTSVGTEITEILVAIVVLVILPRIVAPIVVTQVIVTIAVGVVTVAADGAVEIAELAVMAAAVDVMEEVAVSLSRQKRKRGIQRGAHKPL